MSNLPYISPDLVKSYQEVVAKSSSPATAKRKDISLNRFFNWAESQGHIPENPFQKNQISNIKKTASSDAQNEPKTKSKITGRTFATIGLTAGLLIIVFLLTWKLKFPIPFITTPAQETVNIVNQNPNPIPAAPAVNLAWNLFAKLKITDTNGQPVAGSQSLNFKLFNSQTGGTPLYTSELEKVTTDSNGSALISIDGVPGDLFFQNNELYLEPQIGSVSSTLRIPVSTANISANIGGYYPANPDSGAGPNEVPVINSDGALTFASESPAIIAKNGNLLVEGQTVIIKAADGSGGNIEINPDANGYAHFLFEGNKGNFLNAQAPNLTSGSLYYGMVPNNSTGYYLVNLQNGAPKMTTRFSVDAQGNIYTSGNLNVTGNIATGGTTRLTSGGQLTSINGYSQDSGNFTITQGSGNYASVVRNGTALNDVLTLTLNETGQNDSAYSTLTLNRSGGKIEGAALKVNTGSAIFNGQLQLGRFVSNPGAIGQASLIYNTTDNLVYYYDGSAWQSLGTAVTTPFSLVSSGTNTSAAMVIGSGATFGYTGTGTINASSLEGETWATPGAIGLVTPNTGAFTTLSASSTVNLSGLSASSAVYTDGGSNLTSAVPTSGQLGYWTRSGTNLYNTNQADNVGIGTTGPGVKLDVSGNVFVRGAGTILNNAGAAELQIGYGMAAATTAGSVTRMAIQPYGHTGGPWNFIARDTASVAYLDMKYGATSGLTLDSSGNVGIGTTNPGVKLEVAGPAYTPATIRISGSNSGAGVMSSLSFYENTYSNQEEANISALRDAGGVNGALAFSVNTTGSALIEAMRINKSGNVGIGTTSPTQKLELFGGNQLIWDDSSLGSELITNPTFDADTTGWTAASGGVLASVAGGQINNALQVTNGAAGVGYGWQVITTIPGTRYKLTVYEKNGSTAGGIWIGTSAGGTQLGGGSASSATWALKTYYFTATTTTTYLRIGVNSGTINDTVLFDEISIKEVQGGNLALSGIITGYGGTTGIKVTGAGNVGIGTTAPILPLDVTGSMRVTGGLNLGAYTNTAGTGAILASGAIKSDGAITAGTQFVISGGSLRITNTAGTEGMNWTSAAAGGDLYFRTNNTEYMRITNAGNVGIGTTAPAYKLDVSGDANITGTYRVNGSPISATSNWTLSGNDIYYTTGNVGIGTTAPTQALEIGSETAGLNAKINATLGSELTPSFDSANWTATNGWSADGVGTQLTKVTNAAIGTITPSGVGATPTAGVTYKIVITASATSGAITYTYGGVAGTTITATTITDYITAATTGKLIISGAISSTATITAVSIKALTNNTGDLFVAGDLQLGSTLRNPSGTLGLQITPTGIARFGSSLVIAGSLSGVTTLTNSGAITSTVPTLYVSTDALVQTGAAPTGVTGTLVPLDLSPRIRQVGQAWDIDGAANVLNNYWQEVIAYPGNTVNSKLAWYYSQGAMTTSAEYQAPEIMNYYNNGLNVLGSTYGAESFTNGALTSGTSWSVTNGFSLTSDTAVYLHNASGGTLTQTSANFAIPVKANRWYRFTWTSSALNTTARAYIDPTGISLEKVYLRGTVVTPGTYTTTFKTNASPGNFIITADSAASGDGFTLDNLSLVEVQSGDMIANGLFTGGGTNGIKVDNSGNVGIGTTSPGNKLDVSDSSTSTASAMIRNTSATAATVGLAIKMSATAIDDTTRFINFMDLNGTIIGKVQGNTATTVSYTGNGTDMAEYFVKDDPNTVFVAGTVMCQGPNGVLACSASTPDKIVGIVSDSPVFLGGVEGPDKVIVGLTGQVPVLLSPASPDIKSGDMLTVADNGLATKATGAGYIIGKAQNAWSASTGAATIRITISYIWADPTLAMTNTGNLNIAKAQDGPFQLTDSSNNNSVIDRIGAFGQMVTANIKAGAVIASKITTDGFTAFQGTIDTLLIKSGLVTPNMQVALISPLPDKTDVTVQIGTATESGKFAIQNSAGTEVASIDNSGNAAFAGNASVSGTLYADEIKSKSLDDIKSLLTSVQTDQNLLKDATNWNILTATNSASLNELAVADLYITNQAAINSLSVTNTLTVGSDLVFQSTINNQQLTINSIDTLSAPLKIQSLAMAPLEIMAGLVTIDTKGNVRIAGDLFVAGRIKSSGLTLQEENLQVGDVTDSGKLLTLQDQAGTQVASVNASGSAQFNSLSTQGLTIAGADATVSGMVVNGIITTNSTVGQAIVPAGVSEITIKNPKVTDYTLVYVTPTSSTQNNVLYIKSKQAGQFVVGFANPVDTDVSFNWWIVQVQ